MKSTNRFFILMLSLVLFISCNNSNHQKEKELELEQMELELKKKELELKEEEISRNEVKQSEPLDIPKNDKNTQELESKNELSNIANVIGYWFTPHGATINIRFFENGNFEFNDYNSYLDKEVLLRGEYTLENGSITLFYNDRPKQKLKFYKGSNGDMNYYIKKNNYYFVKGVDEK